MELQVTIREIEGVSILDLGGVLTRGPACQALLSQVDHLLAAGKRKLVLNLAKLTFFDSIGLSALMRAVISAADQGGELRLIRPNDMPLTALAASPLDMYADEAEALASFKSFPVQ